MTAKGKGKILIVEDDTVLVRMYTTKFQHDGYEVVQAFGGNEGIQKAQDAKPDLILLDIMMPKMDGFEVIKTLKTIEQTKNIPVIILTNLGTSKVLVDEARRLGVETYLVKYKTSAQEVIDTVEKALGRT